MREIVSASIPALHGAHYHQHYLTSAGQTEYMHDGIDIFDRSLLKPHISAHRLDSHMIQLVTAGEGVYVLGTHEHYIHKNVIVFASPHVISSWTAHGELNGGYGCVFSDTFFTADKINKQYLADLPFFQLGENQVLCLSDEQAERFKGLFETMRKELFTQTGSADILRGYLQVLLGKVQSAYASKPPSEWTKPSASLRIVKTFMEAYMNDINVILSGQEIKVRKVSEYAAQLGISQNHLNDTVKSVTGKSAGQLMRAQILKQATMCLKHSSKTVSEIAYLMGFEDPSYFARCYKKHTGKMPSEFRMQTL
jgi:AraC family transcriptional activator of pobA